MLGDNIRPHGAQRGEHAVLVARGVNDVAGDAFLLTCATQIANMLLA